MPLIIASRPNVYSGSPLDRVGARRTDEAWIAARLEDPQSLFIPVWRSRNLVTGIEEGRPEAVYVTGEAATALRMGGGPWALLGMLEDSAVFAVDISDAEDPLPLLPAQMGQFADLRSIGWGVPKPEAAMLAHARGLMHWRTRHRFCGVCGAACEVKSAGHMMQCTACNTEHFPRTDPAVIMLVAPEDRVAARPLQALSSRQHVLDPRRLRRTWRNAWKRPSAARCWRSPASTSAKSTTTPASPGRFPATSCWALRRGA